MKTKKKRFIGILFSFALVLTMISVLGLGLSDTAYAEVEKYPVWVGDTQVTSENMNDVLKNDPVNKGEVSFSPGTTNGGIITPAILTLKDVTITKGHLVSPSGFDHFTCGIYYMGNESLDVVLESGSDNTLAGEEAFDYGLRSEQGEDILSFFGEGTLTTSAIDVGVETSGSVIINGGTISSAGTDDSYCYGISAEKDVTVNGGTVMATSAGKAGTGIKANGNVTINSGMVTAEGTEIASAGINASEGAVTISNGAEVNASGQAYGIRGKKDVLINGKVTATSTGNAADPNTGYAGIYSGDYAGIYSEREDVTINGGTVETLATGEKGRGIGAYYGNITINDGEVTASATGNSGIGIEPSIGKIANINGGKVIAIGSEKAIDRTVKNALIGTGWTDTEGKTGKAKIDINTEGQELPDYKRVEFPCEAESITNAKVVLSASAFAYNGKVIKPSIKTIGGEALTEGTDYTTAWSDVSPRNVGEYTITITGKGAYTGVTKATYRIDPKRTNLTKLKKAKKAITVKWKKQSEKMATSNITGYQILLATNSKFTKGKKTVNVNGYAKVSKKVTKLKGGKKYYVKIRTYKTIKGKKYYSPWSKVKTIKTR